MQTRVDYRKRGKQEGDLCDLNSAMMQMSCGRDADTKHHRAGHIIPTIKQRIEASASAESYQYKTEARCRKHRQMIQDSSATGAEPCDGRESDIEK